MGSRLSVRSYVCMDAWMCVCVCMILIGMGMGKRKEKEI